MIVLVGQAWHLTLGRIMLPAEQLQNFPVHTKLVSAQVQVVEFALLDANVELTHQTQV
jgi:hypothetical protein